MPVHVRTTQRQWQILRCLGQAAELTITELEDVIPARGDSISRSLASLQVSQLVLFRKNPTSVRVGRGVPNGWWKLTPNGQKLVHENPLPPTDDTPERGGTGCVRNHQSFMAASVMGSEVPDLLEILARSRHGTDASFVVRLDGDGHEYIFFFEPQLGAGPAERLLAEVRAAEIPVRLGLVGEVRSTGELRMDAGATPGGSSQTP